MKNNAILTILLLAAFGILLSGCVAGTTSTNQKQNNQMVITNSTATINSTTNQTVKEPVTVPNTASMTNPPIGTDNGCLQNAVYFIYADWCPHCQNMKPKVAELESQGYKFVRVNSQDSNAVSAASTCLAGIAKMQYIPEFVCISTAQSHVGEFKDISELKAFADACGANN